MTQSAKHKLQIVNEQVVPFQWKPLTPDEIVRVDSLCVGPAKFEDQQHARYDAARMARVINTVIITRDEAA